MAKFNDLAVELQEAIWALVLPQTRGVYWIEVEGIPREPDYIRETVSMIQWRKLDRIPEAHDDVFHAMKDHPNFPKREEAKWATEDVSGPFFRHLLTTVPAVFGQPGPDDDDDDSSSGQHDSNQLRYDRADEIAYTRRCRQLSTYTQIYTLLSTCRLSRLLAQQHIRDKSDCSWPIHRSMGPLYRPRPMHVWEAQYGNDKTPRVISDCNGAEALAPRIHTLDLVVFRLHDSQGRATPLLRQAAWQYGVNSACHSKAFACFRRVGIEWHPSWATAGECDELRAHDVQELVGAMHVAHFPGTLYWMIDGIPRPDWSRDYPAVVREIFEERMARKRTKAVDHLSHHWRHSDEERAAMLADEPLDQDFEANGRRYYIVFVVLSVLTREERDQLVAAGLGYRPPFLGGKDLKLPEALREPVRLAHDVMRDNLRNIPADGTCSTSSYILSWEPI